MHRFFDVAKSATAATAMLAILAGCHANGIPEQSPASDQFSSIVEHFQVTEIYGGYITSSRIVLYADHEGNPMKLLVDDYNQPTAKQWDGAPLLSKKPLSEFDMTSLEARQHELQTEHDDCDLTTLYFDSFASGSVLHSAYCSPVGQSGQRYIEGSSTLDGEVLVEGPDPRNPDHVAQLARVYDKMLPEGTMVNWSLSFGRPELQDAYGTKTTSITGEPCTPHIRSSGTEITTYEVGCMGLPAYQEQPFHLSSFDPNLVNIVADRVAAAGIDFSQAFSLEFYSEDGTSLTYKLNTLNPNDALKPATRGTIAPIK